MLQFGWIMPLGIWKSFRTSIPNFEPQNSIRHVLEKFAKLRKKIQVCSGGAIQLEQFSSGDATIWVDKGPGCMEEDVRLTYALFCPKLP